MSTADLYTADFPHGSPSGFDRGCTGSSCPNQGDPTYLTCREAKSRKRADWALRNHPDGEPMTREPSTTAPTKTIPDEKHGTPAGYYAGCRLKDACPGIQRAGRSCTAAVTAHQKALKTEREKREASGLSKPTKEFAKIAPLVEGSPMSTVGASDAALPVDDEKAEGLRALRQRDRLLERLETESEAHALTSQKLEDATQLLSLENAVRQVTIEAPHTEPGMQLVPPLTAITIGDVRLELSATHHCTVTIADGSATVQIGAYR